MQVMSFLKACPGKERELQKWLLDTYTLLVSNSEPVVIQGLRINLAIQAPDGFSLYGGAEKPFGPAYDAVIQVWCESLSDFEALSKPLSAKLNEMVELQHSYRVQETEVLNKVGLLTGNPSPGYKLIRGIRFYADMPDSVIKRCWTHHQKLAVKVHIGLARYVCDWVEEPLSPDAPTIQGVTELHFPSEEDMIERYFDSERGADEILHDIGHFISGGGNRLFAQEHVIK